MSLSIIENRLSQYSLSTIEEEQQALKEILQEIILFGLNDAGFFREALFHGGTALRILYNLPRFSEDLDFMLIKPNRDFKWGYVLGAIETTCRRFGVHPEIIDRSKVGTAVQKMFLKDSSIGKVLDLDFHHHPGKKLMIKLEIDVNPPLGSDIEMKFLDFPLDFSIVCQDLPSNFAGKCHALLCREYLKGRDWFDMTWYIARNVIPNFSLLSSAIDQQGKWAGQKIDVDIAWLIRALSEKIGTIDWYQAAEDVRPFLRQPHIQSLDVWSKDFFMSKLNVLENYSSSIG
jgi:hypothetical protein